MAEPALKAASYEDLWDLPEHQVGEILYGTLYVQPRPAPKHALAASSIGDELLSPFQKGRYGGPGGWWILDEPELHLDQHIFVPDLAGWRKSRMPQLPETAWFELVPDWICEVLSPSTAQKDRVIKMPLYARYGVKHVWLVDPVIRTLEVYELQQTEVAHEAKWLLLATYSNDQCVAIPPFEAIDFPLSALWED